ncbi:hypothetical protein, partial [Candidatus Liberibacter solanacearum]|uniref:hypothetical protein n=1 Tax=Candidatus Liberibacter solanacearum TaxID=556287 RepID=UPI00055579E7
TLLVYSIIIIICYNNYYPDLINYTDKLGIRIAHAHTRCSNNDKKIELLFGSINQNHNLTEE